MILHSDSRFVNPYTLMPDDVSDETKLWLALYTYQREIGGITIDQVEAEPFQWVQFVLKCRELEKKRENKQLEKIGGKQI